MATNAVPILFLFLSTMVVGAHPHGDFVEDHDAPHRWLSMPDGTYVCSVCGYVYDPAVVGKAFADEPDTFKCPACSQPKKGFRAWTTADDSKPLCVNGTHHKTGNGMAVENSAVTPDPCATCGDHAKYGLRCLPSAQGGMDNFVGEASTQAVKNDDEHKMVQTADGKYVCTVCGYVYDPVIVGKAFADEPDTFKCPACAQPKKGFRAWTTADDSKPLCVDETHHKTGDGMAVENNAVTPDPCATCGDHAKYGLRCLPSAQGGMDNFVGEAPPQTGETTAAPSTAVPTVSGSLQSANFFQLTSTSVLVLAWLA